MSTTVATAVANPGGAQVDGTSTSTGVNTAVTNPGGTDERRHHDDGVNGAVTATGTPTPQTFTVGQFTVQVGTNPAIDFAGTYATYDELAAAINSKVGGVYAAVDENGVLTIDSGEVVTIGGARAGTGANNLGFATLINDVGGGLDQIDVLSFDAANDSILRIDAALTSVSTLRSTLGAIQNRFQSTINSLSAVSENLFCFAQPNSSIRTSRRKRRR